MGHAPSSAPQERYSRLTTTRTRRRRSLRRKPRRSQRAARTPRPDDDSTGHSPSRVSSVDCREPMSDGRTSDVSGVASRAVETCRRPGVCPSTGPGTWRASGVCPVFMQICRTSSWPHVVPLEAPPPAAWHSAHHAPAPQFEQRRRPLWTHIVQAWHWTKEARCCTLGWPCQKGGAH